jgi:hypothetical protein
MHRRLAAMVGLVVVIALAVTLLYRVYVHHTRAEPYVEDDGGAVVSRGVSLDARVDVPAARA